MRIGPLVLPLYKYSSHSATEADIIQVNAGVQVGARLRSIISVAFMYEAHLLDLRPENTDILLFSTSFDRFLLFAADVWAAE